MYPRISLILMKKKDRKASGWQNYGWMPELSSEPKPCVSNTGTTGTRIMPEAEPDPSTGYPRNDKIVKYLDQCIKSFRELADYGSKVGVIISIENHWGLCANPFNIKIIIDEVNHPFCEATPDFCNWGKRVPPVPRH